MKKIFLILVFAICCVICNGCFCNNIEAKYIKTFFKGNVIEGDFYFISSKSELLILLTNDMPEEYDEEFFKDKSLLIFKIIEPSQENRSSIISYSIKNNIITINVETVQIGADDGVGHWWFILELEKAELQGVDKVKIIKNGEVIMNDQKVSIG